MLIDVSADLDTKSDQKLKTTILNDTLKVLDFTHFDHNLIAKIEKGDDEFKSISDFNQKLC